MKSHGLFLEEPGAVHQKNSLTGLLNGVGFGALRDQIGKLLQAGQEKRFGWLPFAVFVLGAALEA